MLKPSHDMTLWQAAKWADGKGIAHEMSAVYSGAWTGGEYRAVSGKVFCLGDSRKCRDFIAAHPDDAAKLELFVADLEEVAIDLDAREHDPYY